MRTCRTQVENSTVRQQRARLSILKEEIALLRARVLVDFAIETDGGSAECAKTCFTLAAVVDSLVPLMYRDGRMGRDFFTIIIWPTVFYLFLCKNVTSISR